MPSDEAPTTPATKAPLRVLVVDDCEANARLAIALLTKLGAAPIAAPTGCEAIAAVRQHRFDAVLMDCGLPDMDGYEVTRRLRAGDGGADGVSTPIIAFTADSDEETQRLCREAGMVGTLAKPLAITELKALLASLGGSGASATPGTGAGDASPPSDLGGPSGASPGARISSGEPALFDALGLLERVLNDQSIAQDVLDGFLAGLPGQIRQIQQTIESASCHRAASLAHQLKGAAGGVGGVRLRQLALELEAAGRAGDLSMLQRLAPELERESARFGQAVREVDLAALAGGRRDWTPAPTTDPAHGATVLVVEDDPTLRGMLHRMLVRESLHVLTAESSSTAKELLEQADPATIDCVLSDYQMPGETGLELLTWIRGRDATIAAIIMTADDEKSIVTSSLRKGACDFLEKPVDARRLYSAITTAVLQTRSQRRLKRAETNVAAMGETQEQMLHTQVGCATPVDLCFYPKLNAGGDFFSQFQLDATRSFCLLTDVSGHDLQAAYLSAYFHGMARGMLERSATAPELFGFFNRFLVNEWNPQRSLSGASARSLASVAVSSLLIDLEAGSIETITAGAPAPSRVYEDGRIEVVGERGGAPLGWFDQCSSAAARSSIAGGGSLLLWSDGVDEIAQQGGVCVLAAAHAIQSARHAGKRHPLTEEAGDDVLIARVSLPPHVPFNDAFAPLILWRYRGDQAGEIDAMVEYWRKSLRLAIPDLRSDWEHDVLLATREAVLNALVHGCCSRADLRTAVQISYRPSLQTLRVWIEDPGPGHSFDHAAYAGAAATELLIEHRGLIFIHHLASTVRYERNGASLMMDFDMRHRPE